MKAEPSITIACGCDNNYARHTAAMLQTVIEHLPDTCNIIIHLLEEGTLSESNFTRISRKLPPHAVLKRLTVAAAQMNGLPTKKFHRACWHRIFLPELLPDVEKILYLDSDMVVVDDLIPLWETALEDKLFAAVTNPLYPFMPKHPIDRLGLNTMEDYLNTGCLLLNLSALRKTDFSQKIKDYASKHPNNLWPEQDAISALFPRQWLRLHPRWNVQNTFFDLNQKQLPIPQQLILEAINKPAIIHFIGPHKPWHYSCRHPLRGLYYRAALETDWGLLRPEGKTLLNILLKPLPLIWQIKIKGKIPNWIKSLID